MLLFPDTVAPAIRGFPQYQMCTGDLLWEPVKGFKSLCRHRAFSAPSKTGFDDNYLMDVDRLNVNAIRAASLSWVCQVSNHLPYLAMPNWKVFLGPKPAHGQASIVAILPGRHRQKFFAGNHTTAGQSPRHPGL